MSELNKEDTAVTDELAPERKPVIVATTPTRLREGSSSGGGWSDYLRKAVANVEASIDKMLDESSSEVGPKQMSAPSPPAQSIGHSGIIAPETRPPGRVSMQERIANAVTRSGRSSTDGTPRQSVDTGRSANEGPPQVKTSVENESQSEVQNGEVQADQEGSQAGAGSEANLVTARDIDNDGGASLENCISIITKLLESADMSDGDKKLLRELATDVSEQQERLRVDHEFMNNRVESLASKLKIVARNEADRAKLDSKNRSGLAKSIAAKDEQIASLFEEGQMLAKKELIHMNTIKRLRARERDVDKSSEAIRRRCEKAEADLSAMQDKLKKASAVEKVQSDTIRDMSKGQKELEIVRREHAELLEKVAAVTSENEDLRKKVEEGAFEVKETALRDAQERIAELEGQLSRASVEVSELQERLKQERGALECELQQEIKAASKKEGELRREIKDLEAKVEHYRAASEVSLPAGTNAKDGNENALVHQIEVLQAQHSIASENWTGIETRLRDKISDLEKELQSSKLQEVSLRKKYKELSQGSRLLSADKEHLHDQLSALRLELEVAFADHERTKLSAGETEKSLKSQLESLIARVDTLEKEKSALQQECEVLSSKIVDAERLAADLDATPPLVPPVEHPNDDVLAASSPLLGDGRTDRYRAVSGPPLSPAIDQQSSFVVDPVAFSSGAPTADISRVTSPSPGDMSRDYSSTSAAPPATSMQFVGKMNMTIRLLESELSQCRADLDKMRKEKESVYQEVAALFKTNEKLKVYETEVTDLRGEVDQLKAREQTALEMLGEKSELVNELRADVQDLKDMYRQQIEELVDQLQAAKAR